MYFYNMLKYPLCLYLHDDSTIQYDDSRYGGSKHVKRRKRFLCVPRVTDNIYSATTCTRLKCVIIYFECVQSFGFQRQYALCVDETNGKNKRNA